jgi:hypothetical protein
MENLPPTRIKMRVMENITNPCAPPEDFRIEGLF